MTKPNLLLPESTVQYYGAPNWVKCNKGVRGSNLSSPSVLMRVGMYYKISYYKPIRVESIPLNNEFDPPGTVSWL